MKFNKLLLTASLMLFSIAGAHAQSQNDRIRIQMTVTQSGKKIVSDLNNLSMSLTRPVDDYTATAPKTSDTSKKDYGVKTYGSGAYLNLEIKTLSNELLTLFSKKSNVFDGTVTITDSYGKIPERVISFKKARLYSLSDQYSGTYYSDTYGSSMVAFYCDELAINGITIEQ